MSVVILKFGICGICLGDVPVVWCEFSLGDLVFLGLARFGML